MAWSVSPPHLNRLQDVVAIDPLEVGRQDSVQEMARG